MEDRTITSTLLGYRRSLGGTLPAAAVDGLQRRADRWGVSTSDYILMLLADDKVEGAAHPEGLGPPVATIEAEELRDIVNDLQKVDWVLEQLIKRLDPICHVGGDPVAPCVYRLLRLARDTVDGASALYSSNHTEPSRGRREE